MKKNFIDEYRSSMMRETSVIYDEAVPVVSEPVFLTRVDEFFYNPTFVEPIYPVDPLPKLVELPSYGEPIYQPIDEVPQQPVYIPRFPDYSQMSCAQLQSEINELNQTLMTSRLVYEVRMAYESALSYAQDQYIAKCGKSINPPPPQPIDIAIDHPAPPQGCTYDADWNLICIEPIEGDPEIGIKTIKDVQDQVGSGSGTGTSSGFKDDTSSPIKTEVPPAQSNPTFVDDKEASLPTKPVSKNLQPYIYAGLGIVAILIVARMLTKK